MHFINGQKHVFVFIIIIIILHFFFLNTSVNIFRVDHSLCEYCRYFIDSCILILSVVLICVLIFLIIFRKLFNIWIVCQLN